MTEKLFTGTLNHNKNKQTKMSGDLMHQSSIAPPPPPTHTHMGKFKKNVTIQFFYPHALNLQYLKLHLLLKCVFLARLQEVQKSYCSHLGRTRSRSRYRYCSRYRSRSRSRHILLKFSRSLYLDNQLSESIHTWTIGTL